MAIEQWSTDDLAMAQAAIDTIKNGKRMNRVKMSKNDGKAKILETMFQIRTAGNTRSIISEDSIELQSFRSTRYSQSSALDYQGWQCLFFKLSEVRGHERAF